MGIHWHILGAGALGGLWAGLLALSGQTPVLLTRQEPEQGRRRLRLDMDGQAQELLIPAEAVDAEGAPIHHLLVALKAYDVAPALAVLRPRLAPGAVVVLLPNGMGYREEAADSLDGCRVLPATTTQGAWRKPDGTVVRAGTGQCLLGPGPQGCPVELAETLVASLAGTGIDTAWAEDIELKLWHKLAVNGAINAPTALLQCRNGELLNEPHGPALMARLCAETERLMAALGLPVVPDELLARARFVAAQTASNYSSMCQDARAGRRTEVGYINGYIARRAREQGLDAPGHALLAELIGLRQTLQ